MALPHLYHFGSCDVTLDPDEEFPVVSGTPEYVAVSRGNGLRFDVGEYAETFGQHHGRYDGTANEPTTAGGTGRGAVMGATINVSSFASGYVVLAQFMALSGGAQNELRLESDGTLSVWRGGTLICASSAGAFTFATDEYVEYRTLLDGNSHSGFLNLSGPNSSAKGHAGIRLDGTLLAQARAYVSGAAGKGTNNGASGVDFLRFGLLTGTQSGAPQAIFKNVYFGLTLAPSATNCLHTAADPDFLGPVESYALPVTGTAATGGGGFSLTGAASHHEATDDLPPTGDTDYLSGGVDGGGGTPKRAYLTYQALPGAVSTVVAVQPRWALTRTAGTPTLTQTSSISDVWRNGAGSTAVWGTAHASQSYRFAGSMGEGLTRQYVEPIGGAAWTPAAVNGGSFSPAEPSAGADLAFTWRLTSLAVEVLTGGSATDAVPAYDAATVYVCPPAARVRAYAQVVG